MSPRRYFGCVAMAGMALVALAGWAVAQSTTAPATAIPTHVHPGYMVESEFLRAIIGLLTAAVALLVTASMFLANMNATVKSTVSSLSALTLQVGKLTKSVGSVDDRQGGHSDRIRVMETELVRIGQVLGGVSENVTSIKKASEDEARADAAEAQAERSRVLAVSVEELKELVRDVQNPKTKDSA